LVTESKESRDVVLAAYQPVFSLDHISALTPEEMKGFLLYENNKHWTGLHRSGGRITSDMKKLREGLSILLDESNPLEYRLNTAVKTIIGMGKGIVTAILIVAYPEKYGVWNAKSEAVMKELDLWPDFDRGTSFGEKYLRINEILVRLAADLSTDLWVLDSLWHFHMFPPEGYASSGPTTSTETQIEDAQRFGLERHLHEFMRDNWEKTTLGKEWSLYEEEGDPDAGYEYPCPVGRIDLLARSRNVKKPRWLVIELKRNQSSDDTIGQTLRYMGYVQEHLADGEPVNGMVIAHEADDKLEYALKVLPNVHLMHYEVDFRLKSPGKDRI
jgi:hypothetical protein